jgi:hypothetical protein
MSRTLSKIAMTVGRTNSASGTPSASRLPEGRRSISLTVS